MYIEPNTNIKILHNVPLDNTYEHTIYFDSASAQSSYFAGLTKYDLAKYSYQRVQRGWSRVGIKADSLYDCNYMMFQNTSFGNKWFYAFITSVEYVNNVTSEIRFEIDVMQTWMFDYSFNRTFIAREHTELDTLGGNIEPEPVNLGEYVFNDYKAVLSGLTDLAVIVAIVDVDGSAQGNLYDGIYGGAKLYVYDRNDVSTINAKLDEYNQKPDAIVGMYMLPTRMLKDGVIPASHEIEQYDSAQDYTITDIDTLNTDMTIDGYKPRNNKLYSYPYNFYHVDNSMGSSLVLRYEFFDGLKPVLKIEGTITEPVQVMIRPCAYKGVGGSDPTAPDSSYDTLNTETLTLNNYPMCSWNMDAYAAWSAQNSIPIALKLGASAVNAFTNSLKSRGSLGLQFDPSGEQLAQGYGSLVTTAADLISAAYTASIAADISRGNFNNGGANVANKKMTFYGGRCSITANAAVIIDSFFDKFGYAVNRIGVPHVNSRPHWNYIKTDSCTIEGSIPADDSNLICRIYDRGITFWRYGSEVGHYELDNSPTSG